MTRFKLTLEYDGTPFVGWQRQDNGPSVQAALEAALGAFAGHAVTVTAAGRTDAGVHARGQVVHADIARPMSAERVREAANAHLRPAPVAVVHAEAVAAEFHARFDAIRRVYSYELLMRRAPPALLKDRVWHIPRPLDLGAMEAAAAHLLGRHDFTTFRAAECQAASPVKTLGEAAIRQDGDLVVLRFAARSFLHSQVRSMVGSLVEVGRGRWHTDDLKSALEAADRTRCGPLAPPAGLYLDRVDYPPAT